jgi:hypothetical protein
VDGRVQIAARKGNLTISDKTGTTTLAEGQQATRDDSQSNNGKRKKDVAPAAATSAAGAIFDSPWVIGIGGGIAIGGGIWVLAHDDDPVSPAKPKP